MAITASLPALETTVSSTLPSWTQKWRRRGPLARKSPGSWVVRNLPAFANLSPKELGIESFAFGVICGLLLLALPPPALQRQMV
jgi:hypothetical protein